MSGNGPGGLKVGDLYVAVTAAIGSAVKNLAAVAKAVEDTADKIEGEMSKASAVLGDFSDGLLAVSALAAGAFAVASQTSEPARQALEDLKGVLMTLGKEVGSVFTPLVREMTVWVKTAVATWRNLTSEQKASIVTFVKYAAVIGVAGKALSSALVFTKSFAEGTVVLARLVGPTAQAVSKGFSSMSASAGLALDKVTALGKRLGELGKSDVGKTFKGLDVGKVTSGFDKLASTIKGTIVAIPAALAIGAAKFKAMAVAASPLLATITAIAVAVGALVVLAAVLRDTWEQTGSGIKAWFEGITSEAVALGKTISGFVGEMFSSLTGFLRKGVEAAFEFIAAQVRWIAKMAAPVAKWVGADKVSAMFEAMANTSGKKMLEYLDQGVTQLWDAGRAKAEQGMAVVQEIANKAGEAIKLGAEVGADMLATSRASFERGMALLKKDLGFSLELPTFNLPELGDPNTVQGTKTLDELRKAAEDAASFAKDALESVREVTGGLLDVALNQKALMEKTQEWLASNVMAPQFELLFRETLTPAINAAKEAQRAIVDRAKALAQSMAQARDAIAQQAMSRTGELGGVINSGVQGAQAGGVWGAIAAVALDLLTRSEQFKSIIEMINHVLQLVSDVLGRLAGPLVPVVAAVLRVVDVVINGLGPALDAMGKSVEPLAPMLMLLGDMLGPLFQALGSALEAITTPVNNLVKEVMPALFEVFKVVGLVVMNVILGIREAWNAVVGAIQRVLRGISEFEILGGRPFEFLAQWANGLEGAKSDTSGLQQAIQNLTSTTYDQAVAAANQAAAAYQATSALDRMTQSLTNVPSSWKYALRSFESQNARSGAGSMPTSQAPGSNSSTTPSSPAAPAEPSAPAAPIIDTVTIVTQDVYQGLSALERKLDDIAYRTRGSRGRTQYANEAP